MEIFWHEKEYQSIYLQTVSLFVYIPLSNIDINHIHNGYWSITLKERVSQSYIYINCLVISIVLISNSQSMEVYLGCQLCIWFICQELPPCKYLRIQTKFNLSSQNYEIPCTVLKIAKPLHLCRVLGHSV